MSNTNQKFIRQDTHKKKRLAENWRKPRGYDSKKRMRKQNRVIVNPGYGGVKLKRGFYKAKYEIVTLTTKAQVKNINPKKHAVIVSARIGFKKKQEILNLLLEKDVTIINIQNVKKYLADHKEKLKAQKKKKPVEKKEVKPVEKDSIEDKISDEEKKKLEKEEIDKLLTKKV